MWFKEYNLWGKSIESRDVFWVLCQVKVFQKNYSYTFAAHALAPWVTRSLAGMVLTVSDKWFNVFMKNAFCNCYAFSMAKKVKTANITWCFLNKINQETVNSGRPGTVTQNTETKLDSENGLWLIRYKPLPEPIILSIGLMKIDQ